MTTELAPAPAPIAAPVEPARIFSGIQPSGIVHLGNDLGAIRNYVRLQHEYEAIYCIVDYHALTSTHDGDLLRARTREMAASLLALGLDPDTCTLFVQSHRPEHTELAWLLATVTPVSWLERTPTYKARTRPRTSSCRARSSAPSTTATAIRFPSHRPSSRRRPSSSAQTASGR